MQIAVRKCHFQCVWLASHKFSWQRHSKYFCCSGICVHTYTLLVGFNIWEKLIFQICYKTFDTYKLILTPQCKTWEIYCESGISFVLGWNLVLYFRLQRYQISCYLWVIPDADVSGQRRFKVFHMIQTSTKQSSELAVWNVIMWVISWPPQLDEHGLIRIIYHGCYFPTKGEITICLVGVSFNIALNVAWTAGIILFDPGA